MGQVLSSRPDLIPVDLLNELAVLQNHVPAFEFDQVQSIIESEFGMPHTRLFATLESQPFASASIGQVHRATLNSGEQAAVKVQRPGIRKIIETDLEIILHLASIMENNIKEAAFFKPVKIVEEFSKTLEKELDYTIEAANMEQMAEQFRTDNTILIPAVYEDQSSPRVLTMEYIQGIKADDIQALDAAGLDRKKITCRGADLIMKQVFDFGFFHADPHPGNLFVLDDNRICLVDFGMTGFVDQASRETFVDLIHSIATRDLRQTARLLCDAAEYDTLPDLARLEKDLSLFVAVHLSKVLNDINTRPLSPLKALPKSWTRSLT
jgi:ubiquinone biosynthesis protein